MARGLCPRRRASLGGGRAQIPGDRAKLGTSHQIAGSLGGSWNVLAPDKRCVCGGGGSVRQCQMEVCPPRACPRVRRKRTVGIWGERDAPQGRVPPRLRFFYFARRSELKDTRARGGVHADECESYGGAPADSWRARAQTDAASMRNLKIRAHKCGCFGQPDFCFFWSFFWGGVFEVRARTHEAMLVPRSRRLEVLKPFPGSSEVQIKSPVLSDCMRCFKRPYLLVQEQKYAR